MADKTFFDKVYDLDDPEKTRALYDAWAESYEDDVAAEGYATPRRVARALAAHSTDMKAPILDFGCGTGLSGAELAQAGFSTIDGADLSAEMLNGARAKGIYRKLFTIEAGAPLPVEPGDYAAIAAIGVIGSGAAPVTTLDLIFDVLAPGGHFGLSFNDHTLDDPGFEARLNAEIDAGRARLLFTEYGAHLPGMNMNSRIYILEIT